MEHITDARGAIMKMDETEYWKQIAHNMARELACATRILNREVWTSLRYEDRLPETKEGWLEKGKKNIESYDYVQNKSR